MAAFLLLLVKVNLAMSAAVVLVSLLRRPLRAQFGAPIAYALWLLVPVAGLASLLPPRVVILAPVSVMRMAAPASAMAPVSHSVLRLGGQVAQPPVSAMPQPAPIHWLPDPALMLFAAWLLGALFMTWHLARLQLRFHAAVRLRQAGPAVLGFIRPRIVTPAGFETHFTAREQAAILAHERVHLARQDARINALAALLRCLNWFNPLIHLGARWLRIDQELACDASVVRGAVSRRDYASALLKSQLVVASLPLGCNWPGAQHPLIERIAMLKHKPPGTLRRFAGVSLVLLAASFAGLGAWAAQPPVAKTAAVRPPRIVSAVLAAAPVDDTQTVDTNASASTSDAPGNARETALTAPAPRMVHVVPATEPILAALPRMISVSEPKISFDQAGQDIQSKDVVTKTSSATRDTAASASATAPEPVVMAETPSGEGDPNTIVCRAPQRFAGTSQYGEEACGHNYEWKKLALNDKDLAQDDKTLIPRGTVLAMADVPTAGAVPDAQSSGGRPTPTEPALECLLGFVSSRCAYGLWGGDAWPITNCAKQYVHRWLDNCFDGPLERVDYLGTNAAGADVYDVRYMHSEVVYIIAPPGPDGKLGRFRIRRGNINAIVPSSLVDVSASTAGKATLYRRPWH